MTERVIIDTDPGIDDALALILALQSPELEIKAITTVSGNVSVDVATRNVFTVFSLLPNIKRPPVARGALRPLKKDPFFATQVHGEDGLGSLSRYFDDSGSPRYIDPTIALSNNDAVDEILHQLSITSEPLTIISLGPLTNIAAAIMKKKDMVERVRRIVIMGGAVAVAGNVTPTAEFNIFVDPHAASIVFKSGIRITVVGLDVTRQVRLSREAIETSIISRRTPVGQFLYDCTADLLSLSEQREGEASFSLHDPLAVGVAIDPSFVSKNNMHIEIETKGDLTEGMMVADRRPIKPKWKKPPNSSVCMSVDAPRFISLFLERILCPRSS